MMTKCPLCGSTEIISELPLFAGTLGSAFSGIALASSFSVPEHCPHPPT